MKQHIDPETIKADLTKDQKIKLAEWYYSKEWSTSTPEMWLSIGQMIEFLDEQGKGGLCIIKLPIQSPNDINLGLFLVQIYDGHYRKPELCDALWEAVKEVLEDK